MKNKKYCPELTVMSGLAIIYVLMIHAVGSCHSSLYPDITSYADCGFLLCTLCNIVSPAVPMFIFISGFKYALNDSATPYFVFLGKRLSRVVMSFLILNTLFWALDCMSWMETFDPILLMKIYVSSCLGNSVAYQLWYIPMYCCVLIVCPLVCKVIRKSWIRFMLYLAIGIANRVLTAYYPIFNEYPFRFMNYPVFFEMGIVVHEYDLASKVRLKAVPAAVYLLIIVLLSWFVPSQTDGLGIQYLLYYLVGTMVYYLLSISLKESKILKWFGMYSYPLFLLHEPVIGRWTGKILQRMEIISPTVYMMLWFTAVLAVTYFVIKLVKIVRLDQFLWNYRIIIRRKDEGARHVQKMET